MNRKFVFSTENVQEMIKNNKKGNFYLKKVSDNLPVDFKPNEKFKEKLFLELPFYGNLLFDKKSSTIRSVIYMDPDIVNTSLRKDFIYEKFIITI